MRLKVKGRERNFVLSLSDDSHAQHLFEAIEKETEAKGWKVFYNFPPIELTQSQTSLSLKELGIENADTLTIESTMIDLTRQTAEEVSSPSPQMVLKEIPDDNSCLFNAIGYVLENHSLSMAQELRSMIAQFVLGRPELYTEAILGKSPKEYAEWIQKPLSWGGAIELSIFSEIYNVEIASFDVQSGRMYLFGEGRGLANRIYLQYTGIHYEAFVLSIGEKLPKETEQTVFEASDESVLLQVRELVEVSRKSRRFTDLSGFTLRCEICNAGLTGQFEAQKHANLTGHASFVEY